MTSWHNKINWADTLIAYWTVLMMGMNVVMIVLVVWKLWEVVR